MRRKIGGTLLSIAIAASLLAGCADAGSESSQNAKDAVSTGASVYTDEKSVETEEAEGTSAEEKEDQSASGTEQSENSGNEESTASLAEQDDDFHAPWENAEEKEYDIEIPEDAVIIDTSELQDPTDQEEAERVLSQEEISNEAEIAEIDEKTGIGQIVIFGDSQFGNFKNPSGADAWIECYTQSKVYDLAVGGTTAAMIDANPDDDPNTWESRSLVGMTYAAIGRISPEFLKQYDEEEYELFKSCDFSKTDYFIIEYGVNDFMHGVQIWGDYNPRTYLGAIHSSVDLLKSAYPDAKIVIVGPNYAQFFSSSTGEYLGDGNILHNGVGFLFQYSGALAGLAGDMHTIWVDAYNWMRIGPENAYEYLLDGIHLNNPARRRFAALISRFIARDAGYYNFGQAKVEAPDIDFGALDEELLSIDWSKKPE